jgi:hypothetical protein
MQKSTFTRCFAVWLLGLGEISFPSSLLLMSGLVAPDSSCRMFSMMASQKGDASGTTDLPLLCLNLKPTQPLQRTRQPAPFLMMVATCLQI